ncbi:hypothetical protein D3C87_729340 [compost metagenome]|nr:hypothetical protein [Stenotrophomonas sp.]
MPIDEMTGSVLGGVMRFIVWLFMDIFIETILQGTGYWILRWVRPGRTASDSACTVVGLVFWIVLALVAFGCYRASVG